MGRQVFFFFFYNWDVAHLGFGALRTLRIGSSGTDYMQLQPGIKLIQYTK